MPTVGSYQQGGDMEANEQPQTNETVGGDQDRQHGVNGLLVDGVWYQHGWDGWLIDGVWYQYQAANLAANRQPLNDFPNGTLIDSHSGSFWIVDDNGTVIYSTVPPGITNRTTGSVGEEVYPDIILGQGPGPRDTQCPICRVDFEANDWTLTHNTACNTTFHRDCLDEWAAQANADDADITCPQCRAVLLPAEEPPFAVFVDNDSQSDEDDAEPYDGHDPSWHCTYTMEADGPENDQLRPMSHFFGRNYRQNFPNVDFTTMGDNIYDDEAESEDDNGSDEDSDDDGSDKDTDENGSDEDTGDNGSDHDNDDNGSGQDNDDNGSDHDNDDKGSDQDDGDKGSDQANDNNNEAADPDPNDNNDDAHQDTKVNNEEDSDDNDGDWYLQYLRLEASEAKPIPVAHFQTNGTVGGNQGATLGANQQPQVYFNGTVGFNQGANPEANRLLQIQSHPTVGALTLIFAAILMKLRFTLSGKMRRQG